MDHAGHTLGPLHEALAERPRFVIEVPVEALGKHEPLGGLQAETVDFREGHQKASKLLAAGYDAEFRGLLDGGRGVYAGVGKTDDLRLRILRLQKEGGEVR